VERKAEAVVAQLELLVVPLEQHLHRHLQSESADSTL
jgi:hypothetical protein